MLHGLDTRKINSKKQELIARVYRIVAFELIKNSVFSILFYIAPRFSNMLLFIFLGRVVGPTQAGVFTLALTYLLISSTFMRGLDDFVVRQVAQNTKLSLTYLGNFAILRFITSIIIYMMLYIIVAKLFSYSLESTKVILIFALSIFPDSLSLVLQAVFAGNKKFDIPAILLVFVNIIKLLGAIYFVSVDDSLINVAWMWFAGNLLGVALLTIFAAHYFWFLRDLKTFSWNPLLTQWRTISPFFLLTTFTALEGQMDTVLLSNFRSEFDVGLYAAATTIIAMLSMLSQAYRTAVYPVMARYAIDAPKKLRSLYNESLRYLGLIIFPVSFLIIAFSKEIMERIFGEVFLESSVALSILCIALIFTFLNVPNTRIMLVSNHQSKTLKFLFISVIVNLMLNIVLDLNYGIIGASLAKLGSISIFYILNQRYVSKNLIDQKGVLTILKIVISTGFMGAVYIIYMGLLTRINAFLLGLFVYLGVLWLLGGISRIDVKLIQSLVNEFMFQFKSRLGRV